jgi:putative endopeptidase
MKLQLICVATVLTLSACSPAPSNSTASKTPEQTLSENPVTLVSGIIKQNMDLTIKPGDDFFTYVNGAWLANTEIPADKSNYGGFSILRDEAQDDVMAIISSSAKGDFVADSDEQKVGGWFI